MEFTTSDHAASADTVGREAVLVREATNKIFTDRLCRPDITGSDVMNSILRRETQNSALSAGTEVGRSVRHVQRNVLQFILLIAGV